LIPAGTGLAYHKERQRRRQGDVAPAVEAPVAQVVENNEEETNEAG
jgi:DNA-directed RNA polymerase subunit beta'